MSDFYTPSQQALQAEFGTRDLAARLETITITDTLDATQIAFIESRRAFFLTTISEDGWPTVSHKGGDAGFVRVLDERTLVFPSYDGNGMFMSMGNIAANPKIGLLFIDFETPNRIRAQGTAELVREGPILAGYPAADLAVSVSLDAAWVNCPRYIQPMQSTAPRRMHRTQRATPSPHCGNASTSCRTC